MSAREQLDALVNVPGALKIITNEIRPEFRIGEGDPRAALDEDKVRASVGDDDVLKREPSLALKKPSTFVLLDVVSIEDQPNGRVRALAADGSYTEGYAEDVLPRLMEHSR